MKLGEIFIELGVTGDTKELSKALVKMKLFNGAKDAQIKLEKQLGRRLTENEKKFVRNSVAMGNIISGVTKMVTVVGVAVAAIDRMANALYTTNQRMITLQRTTGLSLQSLNKYANANALVNYNATLEGTASSLQNVAQNLSDIRFGQGDISGFQMLGYFGGKSFNPLGMSVEQVIENVREGLKGIDDDLVATKIITSMGFAPDDLLMLRMTADEFEKVKNEFFLTDGEREDMNRLSLELKQIHLQFALLGDRILIRVLPALNKLMGTMLNVAKWATDLSNLPWVLSLAAAGGIGAFKVGQLALGGIGSAIGAGLGASLTRQGVISGSKAVAGATVGSNIAKAGSKAGFLRFLANPYVLGTAGLLALWDDFNNARQGNDNLLGWEWFLQKNKNSSNMAEPVKIQPMHRGDVVQNNEINVHTTQSETEILQNADKLTNQLSAIYRQNIYELG